MLSSAGSVERIVVGVVMSGGLCSGRSAGVLLHPTSLPGPHGVGELGGEALRFVEFLGEAGQGLWQVLPLNPPGAGGSPYSSPSAFAGNPLLVSTEGLVADGLLRDDVSGGGFGSPGRADYASARPLKMERLREAYSRWRPDGEFESFREENEGWLGDFALFMALKEKLGGRWNGWPEGLARRDRSALRAARKEMEEEVRFWEFAQSRFFADWGEVGRAAGEAGVSIIGDLPIFISHDSADVWANQELFFLDEGGSPSVVAGVPPDYFSKTGQLWGNPLYRWDRMREDGYAWWRARVETALSLCDALRLDHFRGYEAYWEVPTGEETAEVGRWVKGSGEELFEALRTGFGRLPLIAEDLGDIGPEVVELRKSLGLPGMKVLQFAFSGPENPFLPHNYEGSDWAVYTCTHDNDTMAGWWADASEAERSLARRYLGREFVTPWDFVRMAHASTAKWAIVPMQDLLGLGSEARMNTPGTVSGNWEWRMTEAPGPDLTKKLRDLTETYGRV